MVSIRRVFVIVLLIISKIQIIFWLKRGASLLLVPRVKAFALPGKSKRATPKAPRLCKYTIPLFLHIFLEHEENKSI